MTRFPGLEPVLTTGGPTERAQRFLASAFDSVAALFEDHYPVVRAQRDAARGRLTHIEQDIFRSAIVFTGAGLDATLKELVRSVVPLQVDRSDKATSKFRDFVATNLGGSQGDAVKRLADILITPNPRQAIVESYVRHLTGSSLQSVQQVHDTLSALGLGERAALYREARTLQDLFEARNQVAHELDLVFPERQGDRHRRERRITASRNLCHGGLNFAQRVINVVAEELQPTPG
ncbi:hypothetical protein ACTMTJ_29000 [Phytohabitans sp. LJ34]|uniref:hypothetical protein n=1 Tax=Phytohabitans sp. LJ34 TaxID=3452217 RepID=UPI003F8BD475